MSDLSPLAGLSALQQLHLEDPGERPRADRRPLRLEALDLGSTPGERPRAARRPLRLAGLNLDGTQVSDLAPLAGLSALRTLNLSARR